MPRPALLAAALLSTVAGPTGSASASRSGSRRLAEAAAAAQQRRLRAAAGPEPRQRAGEPPRTAGRRLQSDGYSSQTAMLSNSDGENWDEDGEDLTAVDYSDSDLSAWGAVDEVAQATLSAAGQYGGNDGGGGDGGGEAVGAARADGYDATWTRWPAPDSTTDSLAALRGRNAPPIVGHLALPDVPQLAKFPRDLLDGPMCGCLSSPRFLYDRARNDCFNLWTGRNSTACVAGQQVWKPLHLTPDLSVAHFRPASDPPLTRRRRSDAQPLVGRSRPSSLSSWMCAAAWPLLLPASSSSCSCLRSTCPPCRRHSAAAAAAAAAAAELLP